MSDLTVIRAMLKRAKIESEVTVRDGRNVSISQKANLELLFGKLPVTEIEVAGNAGNYASTVFLFRSDGSLQSISACES